MAKKRKGLAAHGFMVPILVVRTPEQHRAIIQPTRRDKDQEPPKRRARKSHPPKQVSKRVGPRPPRSRAKRKRLANATTGTSSIYARMYALGYRSYADYLASPHWLDVKERWKASNLFKGWACHSFGCASKGYLSLHHWTYERFGNEQLTDLILVCEDCHRHIHSLERKGMSLEEATARVTKQRLRTAA